MLFYRWMYTVSCSPTCCWSQSLIVGRTKSRLSNLPWGWIKLLFTIFGMEVSCFAQNLWLSLIFSWLSCSHERQLNIGSFINALLLFFAASFMLAYLNEYHLATAVYTFHSETKTSGESRSWLDKIKQAQVSHHFVWSCMWMSFFSFDCGKV